MGISIDSSRIASLQYLRDAFSQFYRTRGKSLRPPSSMDKREFAFSMFRERIMLRHKAFRTQNELTTFLGNVAPSDAYYSCAYYADPTVEMDKKDWLGADLTFDIDADHIPTSCNKIHDEWSCGGCGFIGKGLTPEKCPVCQGQKFGTKTWPCEKCLASAKTEAMKLVDMLMHDFGLSETEMHIYFSGHRGYHVQVESEIIRTLDAVARSEIVSYVTGLGIDTNFPDSDRRKSIRPSPPRALQLDDSGWRGRLAKTIYNFLLSGRNEEYAKIGLNRNIAEKLVQNRDSILKAWSTVGPYRAVKGVGIETWRKIADSRIESLFSKVDTVVTTDIHRLIRMNDTLHGKTGLSKMEFPISRINDFDPFKSAIAFKGGTTTVYVSDAPEFRLDDETFGPYKNQRVELPTAAAILLICRDRAEVASNNVQRTI